MIPMSHLSFVQCEQLKFRPKKTNKMKVYHGVVAVRIVGGHEFLQFLNFFNLKGERGTGGD